MNDSDFKTVTMMERYGGSFVQTLARLMCIADDDNLRRIKATWPEYLQQYEEMAKLEEERHAATTQPTERKENQEENRA
jgi:hypothetical protein